MISLFKPTAEKVEKWTVEKNVKKLLGILNIKDAALRRMATEGLAKVRGPEVLEYCKVNSRSPSKDTRWAITQILGQIGTPEAMKILATVRDPGAEFEDRAKALKTGRPKKED